MIKIEHLSFAYGEKQIFSDFSLSLADGERCCLSAPSGTGKTTLFRLIASLEKPDGGEISFSGKLYYLFQEDRLPPFLSVKDGLLLFRGKCPKKTAVSLADNILSGLGLSDASDKLPQELSGGMCRRAALARLLFLRALDGAGDALLLLDEPFTGLDAESKKQAAEAIGKVFPGATLLMISHDQDEAALLSAACKELFFTR